MIPVIRLGAGALAALLVLASHGVVRPATADDVVVFAAASLKNALDDAVAAFQQAGGDKINVSYAASPGLAKQIERGAPADIFVSADLDWMDYVQQRNLIRPETRKNLLGNRLVLVAHVTSAVRVEIEPNFPLAALLKDGRFAIADPIAVPSGKYG